MAEVPQKWGRTLGSALCLVLASMTLVASVGSASAECTWVLWQHINFVFRQPGPDPMEHLAIRGFMDSRAECGKKLDGMVKDVTKPDPERTKTIERNPGLLTTIRSVHKENGSQIITSYRCLPDTIDPRGAKAK